MYINFSINNYLCYQEKLNSLDNHSELELQSRGQRVLELDRREAILIRREEECETILLRQGNLIQRMENILQNERELLRRGN